MYIRMSRIMFYVRIRTTNLHKDEEREGGGGVSSCFSSTSLPGDETRRR